MFESIKEKDIALKDKLIASSRIPKNYPYKNIFTSNKKGEYWYQKKKKLQT